MYQGRASRLAPARTNGEPSFDEKLARITRRLRYSVTNLAADEQQLLDDYGRGASRSGEARYRLVTFRRLIAIARRSRRPEDREALPELIRDEIAEGGAPLDVEVAFDRETPAPGAADVAQRAFEQDPNPITRERCLEALDKQLATTRDARDAVLHWKPVAT